MPVPPTDLLISLGSLGVFLTTTTYRKMILCTFALVILMGSLTVFAMLQPPAGPTRSMASVAAPTSDGITTTVLDTRSSTQAVELTMNCQSPEHLVFTDLVRQVRLTGEPCLDNPSDQAQIESTEIRNTTNGFAATIFAINTRHYTTDYISLARGQNNIAITLKFKSGKSETHVYRIERAPASLPQKI